MRIADTIYGGIKSACSNHVVTWMNVQGTIFPPVEILTTKSPKLNTQTSDSLLRNY
jgi:hypothetical protein